MMKFTQMVNMGIASILVIPAVALQGEAPGSLEQALHETVATLDHLVKIQTKLEEADTAGIGMILAATEPALPATPERDGYLETLRQDVSRLAMRLDISEGELPIQIDVPERQMINGDATPKSNEPMRSGPRTTGLDETQRQALSGVIAPRFDTKSSAASLKQRKSLEPEDYVADPMRLGRSYFRAGRYDEGVKILEKTPGMEAIYWLGRCLEKLERVEEAIAAYEKITLSGESGYVVDRARNDLEFLKWKRDFRRPTPEKNQ